MRRLRALLSNPQDRIAAHSLIGGFTGRVGLFAALTLYAAIAPPSEFILFSALYLVYQSAIGITSGPVSTSTAALTASRSGLPWSDLVRRSLGAAAAFGLIVACLAPLAVSWLLHEPVDCRDSFLGAIAALATMTEVLLGAIAGLGGTALGMRVEATRGTITAVFVAALGYLTTPHFTMTAFAIAELIVIMIAWRATKRLLANTPAAARVETPPDTSRVVQVGILTNIVIQVGMISQQALMSHFWGEAIIAAFSVANRFASIVILLPTLLTRNSVGVLTRATQKTQNDFQIAFKRYIYQVTLLTGAAAIVGPLAAYAVFSDLMEKYPHSMMLTIVLAFAGIPSAIGAALGTLCLVRHYFLIWLLSDITFLISVPSWVLISHHNSSHPVLAALALPIGYALIAVARVPALRKVRRA